MLLIYFREKRELSERLERVGDKLKATEAASAQAMERLGEAQAHRTETDAILYWKAEKEQVKMKLAALKQL